MKHALPSIFILFWLAIIAPMAFGEKRRKQNLKLYSFIGAALIAIGLLVANALGA